MAKMNIAEKRLPQDGRATVQIGERLVDLRIASLPTNFGERIVIRLLDKGNRLLELGDLGMESQTLRLFRQLINVEHGLILVTGPNRLGQKHHALRRPQAAQQQGTQHPHHRGSDRISPGRHQPDAGE